MSESKASSDRPADRVVLLTNLGTPDDLTVPAVRQFLQRFLGNQRVIDAWFNPPLGWLIGQFRAPAALKMYRAVWGQGVDASGAQLPGSPLLSLSQRLTDQLNAQLEPQGVRVLIAMEYSTPDLEEVFERLRQERPSQIVHFPLYPQYATSTSLSVIERVQSAVDCLAIFTRFFRR